LNDRLGTPEILTDASGTVAWEAWYEPFGEAHVHPSSSVVNNIRLPGQYYDQESGLHYNYHRYYDARTGSYLTPDPIGQTGGINLYMYVGGNAINTIDPFGLYDLWDFGENGLGFAAGLGNAISFGGTTWIAEQFMSSDDAATLRRTKQCSGAFKTGEWASLGLGVGRLAYAGLAKGSSMLYAARGATMENAMEAAAFRNILKRVFRLNPWSMFRIYPFEKVVGKYETAEAIIEAAGRTNVPYNIIGTVVAAGGTTTLATADECECN
jgi:RHS repeat-associated protein